MIDALGDVNNRRHDLLVEIFIGHGDSALPPLPDVLTCAFFPLADELCDFLRLGLERVGKLRLYDIDSLVREVVGNPNKRREYLEGRSEPVCGGRKTFCCTVRLAGVRIGDKVVVDCHKGGMDHGDRGYTRQNLDLSR